MRSAISCGSAPYGREEDILFPIVVHSLPEFVLEALGREFEASTRTTSPGFSRETREISSNFIAAYPPKPPDQQPGRTAAILFTSTDEHTTTLKNLLRIGFSTLSRICQDQWLNLIKPDSAPLGSLRCMYCRRGVETGTGGR